MHVAIYTMPMHIAPYDVLSTCFKESLNVSYLLQPLDLHGVGIYNSIGLSVEQGSGLSNGHWLVVAHSKHLVEVRHWRQVTVGTAVIAGDLLSQLTVFWQCIATPWVCLQQVKTIWSALANVQECCAIIMFVVFIATIIFVIIHSK